MGHGGLREIRAGRERFESSVRVPRHRHLSSYALIVVAGSFYQAGYSGRYVVRAGDVLVQPTLDCHGNTILPCGVEVLRLPWKPVHGLGGVFQLRDLDRIVSTAERDVAAAVELTMNEIDAGAASAVRQDDWVDQLADDLTRSRVVRLDDWALNNGLAAETLSRGFLRAFGTTPARFRFELKTRAAWARVVSEPTALSDIAVESGFADQAHMTRSICEVTGQSPRFWRARKQ